METSRSQGAPEGSEILKETLRSLWRPQGAQGAPQEPLKALRY